MSDKLRNTNLVDMSVIGERLVDILQVGTTTGENNSTEQFVTVFSRHLIPYISNDFLQTAFDNLDKLAQIDISVAINRQLKIIVDISIFSICRSILQLHLFGVGLLHLQRGDILGDIIATKRDDSQMAQDILAIYRHGSCIGTQVNQCAS